ncbi:unnamed protein product, partial [Rotaria magnacalcarata]
IGTVNNVCMSIPGICQNGGTCVSQSSTSISCLCNPQYTGTRCEMLITATSCQSNPSMCLNGGYCTLAGNTYQCACPYGFTGQYCQTSTAPTNGE